MHLIIYNQNTMKLKISSACLSRLVFCL